MTKIQITAEHLRSILDYDADTGLFKWRIRRGQRGAVGAVAGGLSGGYIKIRIDGALYSAHRLAWLYVHGEWPAAEIDHINRVMVDNRLCNLRQASRLENTWNVSRRKNNKSGFTGVHWDSVNGKWAARVVRNKRFVLSRYFDDFNEACAARVAAAALYSGEFSPHQQGRTK